MGQNMGLPGGANDWAREVKKAMETLGQLQEMARRICNDFGLDIANPSRGLYTGATPSVENPVQLKLPSLQDLDIRDAQDGDLLTFDGKRGKWVARRHNTVQLAKEFPQGDPDSYYVPPAEPEPEPDPDGLVLADTWSPTEVIRNYYTSQPFSAGYGDSIEDPSLDIVSITQPDRDVVVELNFVSNNSSGRNSIVAGSLPGEVTDFCGYVAISNLVIPPDASQPTLEPYVQPMLEFFDAAGDIVQRIIYSHTYTPHAGNVVRFGGVMQSHQVFSLNPVASTQLRVLITHPWRNSSADYTFSMLTLADGFFPYYLTPFDGNTADTPEVEFAWEAGSNSAATATVLQRIKIPSTVPAGREMQVLGEGFLPAESIYVEVYGGGSYHEQIIEIGPDGTFETSFTLNPTDTPGTAWVYAYYVENSTPSFQYTPDMTFTITAAE